MIKLNHGLGLSVWQNTKDILSQIISFLWKDNKRVEAKQLIKPWQNETPRRGQEPRETHNL